MTPRVTAHRGDPADTTIVRVLRGRLAALYEQTTEGVADAVCELFVAPEEDCADRLFERLDALYEGVTVAAAEAVCSLVTEMATPPQTRNAQEPAGDAQGAAGAPETPERGGVIWRHPSVISMAVVGEVREALSAGPLSFRALRPRVGRGWAPVRAALQSLVESGDVSREGGRGRAVRFRLVASPPAGWTPLSHLADRIAAEAVESFEAGPAADFGELVTRHP